MIGRAKAGQFAVLAFFLLLSGQSGLAFELNTHERITRAAFGRSVIPDALRDLDIDPARRLKGGLFAGSRIPVNWLVEGARDEDDIFSANPLRFRNHFFDPLNNSGLSARGLSGEPAPDWALEDRQEFLTQAFSYRDARQAFLTALTARAPDDRETALARTFETLGHVIHPLQDMASPPHTRNDPHGGFIFGLTSLYERHLDQLQVLERLNFDGTSVRFGLPRQYWITGDGRGLAEFVNRNFVSDATNFRVWTEGALGFNSATGVFYPSPVLHLGADEQGRPFETTLDIQAQLEPGLRDRSGNLIQGSVTFFANNFQDPIDGVPLRNERMTTLSLFDRELERKGAVLLFTLNRYNIEAQAAFLIPRAVGYSAGLLDYFFRGRLDVDLVPADQDDPSVVRLSGTNASVDALGGGTLTLYADDPADGLRKEATALDPDLTVTAAKESPVESARFQVPEDAERFMAVYKGKLGLEEPAGTFPGGVIGKVVGGIRVEEVFADGANWKLRTPKGVFLLKDGARPLTVAEFEEVRWGDGDNLLVARTPFGQEQANRVVAYELQRQPGSAEVVTTPDGLEVVLDRKAAAGFPFGIPVGVAGQFDRTQVDFLQTVQYQQHQATYTRTDVFQWVAEGGFYKFARSDVGPLEITQPVSQTVSSAASFPLVLDLAHNINGMGFGTAIEPYQWFLSEVGVEASGRLLGLVAVFFSGPGHREALAPAVVVDPDAGPQVTGQASVSPFAPFVPHEALLLWALVDLQAGRVIASTAESLIRMATHEAQEGRLVVAVDLTVVFQGGGPQDGTEHVGWREDLGPSVWEESGDPTDIQTQGLFPGGSWLGFSIGGDYRAEFKEALEGLGLLTAGVHPLGETTHLAPYACEETGREFLACRSIRLTAPVTRIGRAGQLEDARRARPAPGSERLVFLVTWGTLLAWDPGAARAQVVLHEPLMEGFSLGPVTGSVVMFVPYSVETFEPSTFLVPLDGAQAPTVLPGEDLRTDFTLLDPSFLYNAQDLKFYRSKPPLQRTALPAKLADLPDKSNPVGDYHAIRLP